MRRIQNGKNQEADNALDPHGKGKLAGTSPKI